MWMLLELLCCFRSISPTGSGQAGGEPGVNLSVSLSHRVRSRVGRSSEYE
jgi:hypothetical protein